MEKQKDPYSILERLVKQSEFGNGLLLLIFGCSMWLALICVAPLLIKHGSSKDLVTIIVPCGFFFAGLPAIIMGYKNVFSYKNHPLLRIFRDNPQSIIAISTHYEQIRNTHGGQFCLKEFLSFKLDSGKTITLRIAGKGNSAWDAADEMYSVFPTANINRSLPNLF